MRVAPGYQRIAVAQSLNPRRLALELMLPDHLAFGVDFRVPAGLRVVGDQEVAVRQEVETRPTGKLAHVHLPDRLPVGVVFPEFVTGEDERVAVLGSPYMVNRAVWTLIGVDRLPL